MATKPKAGVKKAAPAQFVTADQLDAKLDKFADGILGAIEKRLDAIAKPAPAETKEEKDIRAAGPNRVETNPEWEDTAREYIGEALDHTEVSHERSGGVKFTIVIKKEFSNADANYLEMVKVDRRTKEVGTEGFPGVVSWCKQVAANLRRGKDIKARA